MNESQIKQLVQQELKNILFSKQRERESNNRSSVKAAERNNNETTTPQNVKIQNITEITQQEPIKFNYLTEGTYKGETKKFALAGAVVSAEEEAELTSEILKENFIELGGGAKRPFELEAINTGSTDFPNWKIRVYPSTLAGGISTDLGFSQADNPPYLLNAQNGVFQGKITIDETGAVVSRAIEIVSQLGTDTNTEFHVEIGTIQEVEANVFQVSNSRYGPINAQICRNWFSNPPTYGVTW